jgi:hypothetical protein
MGPLASAVPQRRSPTRNTNNHVLTITCDYNMNLVDLGGLVVIVLAMGPMVREFRPGRGRLIFKDDRTP